MREDSTNFSMVAELTRNHTSNSGDEMNYPKEYVDRLKEDQNDIYYLTGERIGAVISTPSLDTLRKKELEEPDVTDPSDENSVQQPKESDGKKPKSTTKEGLDIEEEDTKPKEDCEPHTKPMKETLGDRAEKAVTFPRMVATPCMLMTSEHG